jgi:hypothetical protein
MAKEALDSGYNKTSNSIANAGASKDTLKKAITVAGKITGEIS